MSLSTKEHTGERDKMDKMVIDEGSTKADERAASPVIAPFVDGCGR